jgi:RNA polymerase sigma-70 factor (ECF subfamily)
MTDPCKSAPDARIVAWIIEGRPECVSELMTRYGGALSGLLRKTLGEDSDLDDICQETWLRVIRYAHRYDPTYAFATWLFRIAWNLAQNRLRQRVASARQPGEPEGTKAELDHEPTPEVNLLMEERNHSLRACVRTLPDPLKESIMLRYFEDLSEREMAERMQVPKGTVKSRLHAAHRRLAMLLGEPS